ncbi:hypothetical protein [Novosphingobium aerophilum]|uniref:Uncharacterized protein n=1 Tax=Novosphingobium aerophilum TaxID=2839843 RepID=A0A7X1F8K6_9SPHN|nr:hypothetical protein [Novosphingobium aerophilum]MBC2652365.1 hypothetical protein [Novosphingobium aerophilum]
MSDQSEKTLIEQLEHELGVHAGTALGLEMLNHLAELTKTKDLNWVDLMVWRLTSEGVPLPNTIQVLAARAAERRLHGADKRGGKPTKVLREFTSRVVHANAAFFQGALGVGAEEAYNLAASAVGAEAGHADKASTISRGRKAYANKGSVASLLTETGVAWARSNPEQLNAMKQHNASVQQRDPGTRRGRRDTDNAN